MKKIISVITILFMLSFILPSAGFANEAIDEKLGLPIVVYGGDLSESEKSSVSDSLNVAEEAEVEEIEVTGQDLVKYIKDGNPSARMFSSAKITREDEGHGLVIQIVTPDNITQVTSDMYANAMLTAGIENASVEIAAPRPVTGHSALVGIYKAYEVNGEALDPERTDVANDELTVATEIADNGVEDEKVSELLTEIKKQIAEQNPQSREDVERIVEEQLTRLQIELSPEDRQLLIDLMDRIRQLDINFAEWSTQLEDLSTNIQDRIDTIVNDGDFWESVKAFFRNIANNIRSLFN